MNNLKKLCYRNGLTFKDLSCKSGLPLSVISGIANGKREPTDNESKVLAKVLGVSDQYLKKGEIPELKFENFEQSILRYCIVNALPREEMAQELGINYSSLANLVQGRVKPCARNIGNIIMLTGVPIDEFLSDGFLEDEYKALENVGTNIKKYLDSKKMSKEDLAKKIGISEWTVRRMIAGELTPKTFSLIIEGTRIPAEEWIKENFLMN